MELLENDYRFLSPANQKRYIKGKIMDILKSQGFQVDVTDTPSLTFFTDKPINAKSIVVSDGLMFNGQLGWHITSFGRKGALRIIEENKS